MSRMPLSRLPAPQGRVTGEALLAGLIALLSLAFGGLTLAAWDEAEDAQVVQKVHTALQTVMMDATTRLEVPPERINPKNLLNAVRAEIPPQAQLDESYTLRVLPQRRGARFKISPNGEVRIEQLIDFTRFRVNATYGTIEKH